jgi:hypothetical protein
VGENLGVTSHDRSRRLWRSLLSSGIGWVFGFLYYAIAFGLFFRWARWSSVAWIALWSGVYVGVSWVMLIPAIGFAARGDGKTLSLPFAPFAGAAAFVVTFQVLIGWWTGYWKAPLLLGYSAVVGFTAGLAYSLFQRRGRPG